MKLPLRLKASEASRSLQSPEIEQQAQSRGFLSPGKPKGDHAPQLEHDVTSLPSHSLGRLLSEFTSYADYTAYQATLADIDATHAEQELATIIAKVRLEKSGTVQEKADKTEADPRVIKATAWALERRAFASLVETYRRNTERDCNALSREITRRGNENYKG